MQEVKLESGEKATLLLLDTEGFGSMEQTQQTDSKIFLIASLLSSYLIYNSFGTIDEKALDSLNAVLNLSKKLDEQTQQRKEFPQFMWLIRDFALRLVNKHNQPITSSEYLEEALSKVEGHSQAIIKKNRVRDQIKSCLSRRDCFTLIRPTELEVDLQNLSSLQQAKLRPEFVQLCNRLRNNIFRQLQPKTYMGVKFNIVILVQFLRRYINCINSDSVPKVDCWQSIAKSQNERLILEQTRALQKSIKEELKGATTIQQVAKCIRRRVQLSVDKINQESIGDKQQIRSQFELKAKKIADDMFNAYLKDKASALKGKMSTAFEVQSPADTALKELMLQANLTLSHQHSQLVINFYFQKLGQWIQTQNIKGKAMQEQLAKARGETILYKRGCQQKQRTANSLRQKLGQFERRDISQKDIFQSKQRQIDQLKRTATQLRAKLSQLKENTVKKEKENIMVMQDLPKLQDITLLNQKLAFAEEEARQQAKLNQYLVQALNRKNYEEERSLLLQKRNLKLEQRLKSLRAQNERLREFAPQQSFSQPQQFQLTVTKNDKAYNILFRDSQRTCTTTRTLRQIHRLLTQAKEAGMDLPLDHICSLKQDIAPSGQVLQKVLKWMLGSENFKESNWFHNLFGMN